MHPHPRYLQVCRIVALTRARPPLRSARIHATSQPPAHNSTNVSYNPQIGGCPNLSHVRVAVFFAGGQFLVCMSLKNVADIWLWTISCVGRFWPWPSTGKNVAKIVAKTGRGERGQGCSQRTRPPCSSFCKLLNLDILCVFYIQNTFLQI